MFEVHGNEILLTRGDTGLLTFTVEKGELSETDCAVFTVRAKGKRRAGEDGALIRKELMPVRAQGRLCVQMPFEAEETRGWTPGEYEWDIRFALGARWSDAGELTGAAEVVTPMAPGRLVVVKAVGEIC